jgi:hypothetical protein
VAACTGISGTTEVQTITASAVPFDRPSETANRIEFQIADMKGYASAAMYTVHSGLVYLPLVMKDLAPEMHRSGGYAPQTGMFEPR